MGAAKKEPDRICPVTASGANDNPHSGTRVGCAMPPSAASGMRSSGKPGPRKSNATPLPATGSTSTVIRCTSPSGLGNPSIRLEINSHFLDEYDRRHEPQLPEANPLDVLRLLVEERGMTGKDLSQVLGASRNLGAMILRGERRLTADHIRTLAAHFNVPATSLL